MAISIDWPSKVIFVPQADLTSLGGSDYELDLDWFRLRLKDLEDDEEGMPWPRTHEHETETILAGVTFARKIRIINGYTVTFEDGVYGVNCVGANSNVADVLNRNSVSVNTANSAGLIVVSGGSVAIDDVRAGLDAHGYTEGRAGALDNLDAAVSDVPEAIWTHAAALRVIEGMMVLGLDATIAVEHGETYIRAPADGSIVNIRLTRQGDGSILKERL